MTTNLTKNFTFRNRVKKNKKVDSQTIDKLFVYGSLNNDYYLQLLTGVTLPNDTGLLLNHRRIQPENSFSFALPWKGFTIEGRLLYHVTPDIIKKLDDYESEGKLYKRKIAQVQVKEEIIEAWVYIGKPKSLKPYFTKGFEERDRIEEFVEKNVTRYIEQKADLFINYDRGALPIKVTRELLSEEVHSILRQYFQDSGLPAFIIKHEIEKASIPRLTWLKSDPKAMEYADNYIKLATNFMIFNQLEEKFRNDYRSEVKVSDAYYMHTISAMMALKLMVDQNTHVKSAHKQLEIDRFNPELLYTDYAAAAILIAEELYERDKAEEIVDWVNSNRHIGLLPLGAELEFSNIGYRAIGAKEGADPVFDSFYYFYNFDLMRRGWKLGAHIDDHKFLTSPNIRTRGFLELAFGRYKLLGDVSKPATEDSWILSSITDLAVRFMGIKPHSLHISIEIPANAPFKKLTNPDYILCLLTLGGDLREDENGKLREMRIFNQEIFHKESGLNISRLNKHHKNPEEDVWTPVVEYQFPRLFYEYDYQPLIMALKGFQLGLNPYPFKGCSNLPDPQQYIEMEQFFINWASRPAPIPEQSIDQFLVTIEEGLDKEVAVFGKEHGRYTQRIIGRIEEQIKRRTKRIKKHYDSSQ